MIRSERPRQRNLIRLVLSRLAAQKNEKLDWRKSIVDCMKVLGLDSSLSARKQLAQEMHYTGANFSISIFSWIPSASGIC